MDLNDKDNINVIKLLKYEKLEKQFTNSMERNALLSNQYWTCLLEDSPNMTTICDIGLKILKTQNKIEKYWDKIQEIYRNNLKDLSAYSIYLEYVWNDNGYASQISERIKEISYSNKYGIIFTAQTQSIENISTDGSSCVFMSGDKVNLRITIDVNRKN